jgi:hypothetical protein
MIYLLTDGWVSEVRLGVFLLKRKFIMHTEKYVLIYQIGYENKETEINLKPFPRARLTHLPDDGGSKNL